MSNNSLTTETPKPFIKRYYENLEFRERFWIHLARIFAKEHNEDNEDGSKTMVVTLDIEQCDGEIIRHVFSNEADIKNLYDTVYYDQGIIVGVYIN